MSFEYFDEALSFMLWGAFALAVVLGVVVNKTNFCTMGAVSDMVNMQDYSRIRAWLLAIAVAMIGVSVLEYLAMVNVSSTFPPYRASQFIFGENLIGGFMFGIGMTFASGCGNKTLIRIGGGNIKSIFVLAIVGTIAYYMVSPLPGTDHTIMSLLLGYKTEDGSTALWIREVAINLESQQDIGAIIGGEDPATARLIAGLLVASALLFFIFKAVDFRSDKDNLMAGIVIGAVIVGGWYLSSNVNIDNEEEYDEIYTLGEFYQSWDMILDDEEGKPAQGRPLSSQSYTFVNPMGQTFGYAANKFDSATLTFGVVSVFGVIFGSLLWSLISRSFRIEWFHDKKDFFMHAIGAVLMGFGGTLALGCTIGQGITGVSTLALGSILTLISIIFGSALTMKIQYYRMLHEEASFGDALLTSLVDMKLLPASMRKLENL